MAIFNSYVSHYQRVFQCHKAINVHKPSRNDVTLPREEAQFVAPQCSPDTPQKNSPIAPQMLL